MTTYRHYVLDRSLSELRVALNVCNELREAYAEITLISKECRKKAAQNKDKFAGGPHPTISPVTTTYGWVWLSPAGGVDGGGKLKGVTLGKF